MNKTSAAEWLPGVPDRHEAGMLWMAFGLAVLAHIGVMLVHLPEIKAQIHNPETHRYIVVKKYTPPPPRVEHKQMAPRQRIVRKVPLPDPTPDEPEPIREPAPEFLPDPIPDDVELLLGDPETSAPPPPTGPVLPGVGGVSQPVLIPESKWTPDYPEIARAARIEGNVVLQAVIHKDGSVGEITVLRCTKGYMGFEEAAVQAVSRWRYEPAIMNNKPVDCYFTVIVNFELL
jgi:protein TonB